MPTDMKTTAHIYYMHGPHNAEITLYGQYVNKICI